MYGYIICVCITIIEYLKKSILVISTYFKAINLPFFPSTNNFSSEGMYISDLKSLKIRSRTLLLANLIINSASDIFLALSTTLYTCS